MRTTPTLRTRPSWRPRLRNKKFALKAKPRSKRGIYRKETPSFLIGTAADTRESSRRVNRKRRERTELFFQPEKKETWPEISLRVRREWWDMEGDYLVCGICNLPILQFADLVPDHIIPGKMGGCKDHSEGNLQPAHWWCNREKGSKRPKKSLEKTA